MIIDCLLDLAASAAHGPMLLHSAEPCLPPASIPSLLSGLWMLLRISLLADGIERITGGRRDHGPPYP